jgi:hypothetical protein
MEVYVSLPPQDAPASDGTRPRRRRAHHPIRPALTAVALATLVAGGLTATGAGPAQAATGGTRTISASGTAQLTTRAVGADGLANPELRPGGESEADAGGPTPTTPNAPKVKGADVRPAGSAVRRSFDGVNLRDQRLANGGNQFTVEPPDQGLCSGNGYVLESVNDVLRVYTTSGAPATSVVDLNTFYGYPAAIDRTATAPVYGPSITDPSCMFDKDVQRWFQTVLTLDTNPATGDLTGPNHIDIAVSTTADPTGTWTIYKLPVQDDGTNGTPNHGCTDDKGAPGPCIGDYPHLGADANGFYVTTNEYELFGDAFIGAQVYAFSKRALAKAGSAVNVTQIDTRALAGGRPGFTVWPAIADRSQNSKADGGTEYFLSSDAAEEASGVTGGTTSNRIWTWRLTNSASLDTASPNVNLTATPVPVKAYQAPPPSDQKQGPFPLGQCINDTTTLIPQTPPAPAIGPGCWQLFFDPAKEPAHNEVLAPLDSNDTRMQQVSYADGKLWGALDTAVRIGKDTKAGVEAFVVDPRKNKAKSGYLGVEGNNVTYPAVGVTRDGKAVVAMTLVGKDYHPSAVYAALDDDADFGPVRVIAAGKGPQDGFTGYKALVGDPPRPRWGDYGATAVDGNTIWMASEYIAQSCTLAQYLTPPIGSCGGTRVSLGNWATRISQVKP